MARIEFRTPTDYTDRAAHVSMKIAAMHYGTVTLSVGLLPVTAAAGQPEPSGKLVKLQEGR